MPDPTVTPRVHPLDSDDPNAAYEWAIATEHNARWERFRMWEQSAANKGGGLTREQLTGARIFHEWLKDEERP